MENKSFIISHECQGTTTLEHGCMRLQHLTRNAFIWKPHDDVGLLFGPWCGKIDEMGLNSPQDCGALTKPFRPRRHTRKQTDSEQNNYIGFYLTGRRWFVEGFKNFTIVFGAQICQERMQILLVNLDPLPLLLMANVSEIMINELKLTMRFIPRLFAGTLKSAMFRHYHFMYSRVFFGGHWIVQQWRWKNRMGLYRVFVRLDANTQQRKPNPSSAPATYSPL